MSDFKTPSDEAPVTFREGFARPNTGLTLHNDDAISFFCDGKEVLKLSSAGEVRVRGQVVDSNAAIYEGFRAWLNVIGVLKVPPLNKDRRPEHNVAVALEHLMTATAAEVGASDPRTIIGRARFEATMAIDAYLEYRRQASAAPALSFLPDDGTADQVVKVDPFSNPEE